MASGLGESTSRQPQSPSCSDNNGDASNFECNICLDLAQDPIVTLCGHLFCWPCLYKWLHIHSHPQECPVCKAIIEEQKLVPLYGRGKTSTDPRSKGIPGINIPNRPAGQRPEAAGPPPEPNPFPHNGFGFMGGLGGFAPMASTRFGNFTLSAAFGGLVPSLFNFQMHGYADPSMYGAGANFPYGFPNMFHGSHGHAHGYYHQLRQVDDICSVEGLSLVGLSPNNFRIHTWKRSMPQLCRRHSQANYHFMKEEVGKLTTKLP